MTKEKEEYTEEQKQEFLDCVKDTHDVVIKILEEDTRTNYLSRVMIIARSIARLQKSDIEITQCLRSIIDAFNMELEDYSEFRKTENERMAKSLKKFRESAGEEINYFSEEERKLH